MGLFDRMDGRESKKEKKRRTLTASVWSGKRGERESVLHGIATGHSVERAPHGQDYIFRKGGRKKYVEVKTGNARLSKLQQKRKMQKKGRYTVYRTDRSIF
jgi:hypothetical protein